MSLYLVVHTPVDLVEGSPIGPPTRLVEFAEQHGAEGASPRWIRAWSPDLHDDRVFTLWDSSNADEIHKAISAFGFLDTMEAHAVAVQQWGPEDVMLARS